MMRDYTVTTKWKLISLKLNLLTNENDINKFKFIHVYESNHR